MKVLGFGEKSNTPVAVALGFFDCVHKGHAAVIARAKELAGSMGAECAVFTFRNDRGRTSANKRGFILLKRGWKRFRT